MKNFEKKLERLNQIIKDIEEGCAPLESSLEMYKEGMSLAVECAHVLNELEKDVMILKDDFEEVFQIKSDDNE